MAYFPFMIDMKDRLCVIAGGGRVALRKIETLIMFGAKIKVIAPDIISEIYDLQNSNIEICKRTIEKHDVDDAFVVIMATNNSRVNEEVANICKERNILVNVVDVKKDCGFYFPAIIKEEDVVISVSTGGNSPVLASRIKKEIKENLSSNYGKIAKEMGEVREKVIASEKSEEKRKEKFQAILEQKINEERQ